VLGPLIGERRVRAMERFVADARARRPPADGGERTGGPGFHFPAAVLSDVGDDALVTREEPFGPLAPLAPFSAWEDALERANALPYGLAAYVFTDSQRIAESAARDLKAGNLGINQMAPSLPEAPFGGVDQSGLGYEGMRAFLQMKLVNRSA
jgi:succinate-semialdehyde dehydrogenase/glutarate-semialdehyde dehydrogenase